MNESEIGWTSSVPPLSASDEILRIREEARNIMNASFLAAEQHYAAETPWYMLRNWTGAVTAVLSAVASGVAFKWVGHGELVGYLSGSVAILSALSAVLKPGTQAELHHKLAKGFEVLYNQAGYFYRIESRSGSAKLAILEKRLAQLSSKSEQLKSQSPPLPGSAYRRAAKHIRDNSGEVIRYPDQDDEQDGGPKSVSIR